MAKDKVACILARVSRPNQNLESQIEDLLRIAQQKGYSVPQQFIFSEKITGVDSGFKKSLDNLLFALDNKKNHIEAVFMWEVNRLSRGAYDFATELMQINSKNVPVYFLDMNLWTWDFEKNCLSKENCDKLVGASLYGRIEWDKIKQRTTRGRNAVAAQGLYVGHLADGYIVETRKGKKCIVIDDERRGVIEEIFSLFIDGKSSDEIAAILNAKGIPTTAHYRLKSEHFKYRKTYRKRNNDIEYDRSKTKWSGATISAILRNPWYVGKRSYDGKEYTIEKHIITDEDWEKATRLREDRRKQFRSKRNSRKHQYLLSNLIICGKCGRPFYGHFTGKNNHYFCSSVEHGKKCGTRGINKENFEAIVCMIVRGRALFQTAIGEDDVTSDFFKISEVEKKTIKKEIASTQKIIDSLNNEIREKQKKRENLIDMKAEAEEDDKDYIEKLLQKNKEELSGIKSRIETYMVSIQSLNKRLRLSDNIDVIIGHIKKMNNLDELRQFLEATVKQIIVYTIDKSINYVEIKYINDKIDDFIYSYPLLKNNFLQTGFYLRRNTSSNGSENNNEESKKRYEISLEFDPQNKVLLIPDGCALTVDVTPTQAKNKPHIIRTYDHSIDFRSLILGCKNDKDSHVLCYSYDPTPFIEDDERREIQAKREKEYQASRNNGLPTTLPYVVRDGNYEEYVKQRKHLYNRRYKIKKHKRLSIEEKQKRLEEISRQLALLRAKVKYLNREESVKEHNKKQKQ